MYACKEEAQSLLGVWGLACECQTCLHTSFELNFSNVVDPKQRCPDLTRILVYNITYHAK